MRDFSHLSSSGVVGDNDPGDCVFIFFLWSDSLDLEFDCFEFGLPLRP